MELRELEQGFMSLGFTTATSSTLAIAVEAALDDAILSIIPRAHLRRFSSAVVPLVVVAALSLILTAV